MSKHKPINTMEMYVHIKSCLQKSQSTHNYINDVKVLCWNIFDIHTHVLNNIKVEVSVSTPVHIHT